MLWATYYSSPTFRAFKLFPQLGLFRQSRDVGSVGLEEWGRRSLAENFREDRLFHHKIKPSSFRNRGPEGDGRISPYSSKSTRIPSGQSDSWSIKSADTPVAD